MGGSICVVGALDIDLVVRAQRMPEPGETIRAASFATHPGGRGGNQAVAASRLGARAAMVGALGDDAWGGEIRALLASEGIDIEHVVRLPEAHTGVGLVGIVEGGESAMLVASGANLALSPVHVEAARDEIAGADLLCLANEVPLAASLRAARIAREGRTRVLFNAAPAGDVAAELLGLVDVLVLNAAEARALSRCEASEGVSASGMARRLFARGPSLVAITLGRDGALLFDGETMLKEPAPHVETVDTVGAGDAFVAALATAQVEGMRAAEALRFACAAGGLATTVEGAMAAMPSRERVEELLGAPRAGG